MRPGFAGCRFARSPPPARRRRPETRAECARTRRPRACRSQSRLREGASSPCESSATIRAIGKIIFEVLLRCFSMPLRRRRRPSDCGSPSSSGVTIHGPIGQLSSRLFPLNHWPCSRCRSRAVTSLSAVYPKTTCSASSSGTSLHSAPMTTASSASKSYSRETRELRCSVAPGAAIARRRFGEERRHGRELQLAPCSARSFACVLEIVASDAEDVARGAHGRVERDVRERNQIRRQRATRCARAARARCTRAASGSRSGERTRPPARRARRLAGRTVRDEPQKSALVYGGSVAAMVGFGLGECTANLVERGQLRALLLLLLLHVFCSSCASFLAVLHHHVGRALVVRPVAAGGDQAKSWRVIFSVFGL